MILAPFFSALSICKLSFGSYGQIKNGKIHKVVFKHNKEQVEFINARLVEASGAESGMGRLLSSQTNVLPMFRSAEEIT